MKFKVLFTVLVLFSCQFVVGSLAAEPIYNRAGKGNTSSGKFGTSGSGVGAPINLKSLSSSASRGGSVLARSKSRNSVYSKKKQNASKYRLSMSPDQARRARAENIKKSEQRKAQRDKAADEKIALARQEINTPRNSSASLRPVRLQEEIAEEKEEAPKKKKKRIYKKADDGYKMPKRIFSFN